MSIVNFLHGQFEKLSGDNALVRRIRGLKWRAKSVSLDVKATLKYSDVESIKTFVVVPGGARSATYLEQMQYQRTNLLILRAVLPGSSHDANVETIIFSLPSEQLLIQWRDAANKAAANTVISSVTQLEMPILIAWGHTETAPTKYVSTILRRLNLKLKPSAFEELFLKVRRKSQMPKTIAVRDFVNVILYHATQNPFIVGFQKQVGRRDMPTDVVADILRWPEIEVQKALAKMNASKCTTELLLYLVYNSENSIIDNVEAAEPQDLTRPLNEYIVNSSHNTYLRGDQLQSDSTADMYRIVLEKGCRCVEIDMWDGDDGKPIVKHGRTMTSPDTLENILKVINEHAFAHDNLYPVILSLENHLSYEQAEMAARLLEKYLGEKLLKPDLSSPEPEALPSLESLLNKILIKAKAGRSVLRKGMSHSSEDVLADLAGADMEDEDSSDFEEDSSPRSVNKKRSSSALVSKGSKKDVRATIPPSFAELVYLSGGNRTALMGLWKKNVSGKSQYVAASCVSLNEKKIAEVVEKKWIDNARAYNSHSLTRVYPKGTRVDSSNYMPTVGHYLGCQLVALNWQVNDYGLAVNEARFRANGGCGYVLWRSVIEPALPGVLRIHLISAFLLPRPKKSTLKKDIIDSYCIWKLYDTDFGDDYESSSFKFESKVVRSNGFHPTWNEEITIPIKNRAFSVIHVAVYDHDLTSEDDMVGYCAIPVALIREGTRCCVLRNKFGDEIEHVGTSMRPSVLCSVTWER